MAKLNRQTATAYVEEHLIALGYEDVQVVHVHAKAEPIPSFEIIFSFRSDDSESGVYVGQFDVWLQDGELYGEW